MIQPRVEYLSRVTGAIMGLPPTDARVLRAITSLQGQCLLFTRPAPAPPAKTWGPLQSDVDGMVDHIAEFSLAGMKAVAPRRKGDRR